MTILAIETSCDETAIAISKNGEILCSLIASQISTHKEFGGVVPEVAARMHIETILPLITEAFNQTNITHNNIDAIAVTKGPGLLPSLLIGVDTAKSLAYAWNKPLIGVNHLEGHVYSTFIEQNKVEFPLIMLLVSGGHTQLILMTDHGKYKILGETLDDAAGESFDKVARMLDLPYPGGPEISKIAKKGNKEAYAFPTPLKRKPGLDFSFSGIKTEARKYILFHDNIAPQQKADIAASFEYSVVSILLNRLQEAAELHSPKTIAIAGGVSANTLLRDTFLHTFAETFPNAQLIIPEMRFCTDNAAMIARAAEEKYKQKEFKKLDLTANSREQL